MTDRLLTTRQVVDRIALAIVEHGPMSGSDLSIRLAVRKATVLALLKADPRFERLGYGRGSRWSIAASHAPLEGSWEPMGTDSSGCEGETLARRVGELHELVAEIERLLAGMARG